MHSVSVSVQGVSVSVQGVSVSVQGVSVSVQGVSVSVQGVSVSVQGVSVSVQGVSVSVQGVSVSVQGVSRWVGPNPEISGEQRWHPEGWGPEGWGPKGGGQNISRFFSSPGSTFGGARGRAIRMGCRVKSRRPQSRFGKVHSSPPQTDFFFGRGCLRHLLPSFLSAPAVLSD